MQRLKRTLILLSMKFFYLLLFASLFIYSPVKSQTQKPVTGLGAPVVDKRVELICIAARLADFEEYSNDYDKSYVRDIHQYFDKYKNHPLVKYMQQLREANGIGYDAVVTMAVHLTPLPALKPVIAFNDSIPDKRYGTPANALKFAALLRDFYKATNFKHFFDMHQETYKSVVERFASVFNKLDAQWFPKYYGLAPKGSFKIIIGVGLGSNNYGPKVVFPNGSETIYAIMGVWQFDDKGLPVFEEASHLPTLVHEFNHSFVNNLTHKNRFLLQNSGSKIFTVLHSRMQKLAYGEWEAMFSESLVRASVVRYLMDHGKDSVAAEREIQYQQSIGFLWIRELVALLGKYEINRKRYPTLESFMPEIVEFYEHTARDIPVIISNYQTKQPHVVAITPFSNGSKNVDPSITELKITFDKSLAGKGYSINFGESGKEHFPIVKVIGYTDNNTAVVLQLVLKPDFDYEFNLTGRSFKTADGYPLEDVNINFKTKK